MQKSSKFNFVLIRLLIVKCDVYFLICVDSFLHRDKNFVKQYPELQKSLDEELNRVTRQYGGNTSEDLMKFPEVHLEGNI